MAVRKIGFSLLMNAVYDLLDNDILTSKYRIFDHVPSEDKSINTSLPYVTIGTPYGVRSASGSADDTPMENNIINIHVWSDYKGHKECADMMDNICQAMDGATWTIGGYTVVISLLDYSNIFLDDTEPAVLLHHGIIRWRFEMV